jgi:hypothetical protein
MLTRRSSEPDLSDATVGHPMDKAGFRDRLVALGLSVHRFAAMTGVAYGTARHWGGTRKGTPMRFPRWVPLMLEKLKSTVARKPPDEAVRRPPTKRDDEAWRHPDWS